MYLYIFAYVSLFTFPIFKRFRTFVSGMFLFPETFMYLVIDSIFDKHKMAQWVAEILLKIASIIRRAH